MCSRRRKTGVGLIITVDNGISSHEAAAAAREYGVDLIVTDHHAIEGSLPEAHAVLNPKRHDDTYAGLNVSGAAVAFKLACALTGEVEDLDLAALGTVAGHCPPAGREPRPSRGGAEVHGVAAPGGFGGAWHRRLAFAWTR